MNRASDLQATFLQARGLVWSLLFALLVGFPGAARAQTDTPDGHRAVATREELQAALAEAERIAASDGFSASFREAKQREAAMIRERLENGDFQVGDQIQLTVFGEPDATGLQTVGAGPTLSVKGLPDIPLRGVLRSEIEPYLKDQIGHYIRDAQVKARATIRLSIIGGVVRPGFYQLDADMMMSDAIMSAGGVSPTAEFKRSVVRRGDERLLEKDTFSKALQDGQSIDQLNLRAGDVIEVGEKPVRSAYATLQTVAIIPGLILSVYGIGKLAGAF
ncbi:MAG TPA: polysaccharide biosynthesis/export family protein [Gemmatimonadales bacterium]|jgi:protein involved in polysaccharide export with SLBB domain|nr:polysaccharide biosynthesis/export family protein [Gemmatimonadales bacterium]